MTIEYYHLAPVILDDGMYTAFGGITGTSTPSQRTAAYQIAESEMIRRLNTFLLPTTVTGTFLFGSPYSSRVRLPLHHLISVDAVTILSSEGGCNCDLSEDTGCAYITDAHHGYIDVKQLTSSFLGCGCSINVPYQARVAVTAGLPTGVAANDASLHLALTMVAQLALLEIIDPHGLEGGAGDPGVQDYVNMGYGEKRTQLQNTVFGSSAVANKAWRLVQHLTPHVVLKLGG